MLLIPGCGGTDAPKSTGPEAGSPEADRTVMVDRAHHNLHTLETTLGPFARILTGEGFEVIASATPFRRDS
ncbi:MAG: hypothetical protein GWN07_25490, partial [Actinobacteria bacterium]|nr:hypothetical protein [Actinomycetota bacterium]